jgi:hypothetical protein
MSPAKKHIISKREIMVLLKAIVAFFLFNWITDFPYNYSIYITKKMASKNKKNTAFCAKELWHLILFCCNKPNTQAFHFEELSCKHKQAVQLLSPLSTKWPPYKVCMKLRTMFSHCTYKNVCAFSN